MDIRFYNTLTHRIEAFEPLEPGRVSMYNCGPTVYDFAHIGNFRAFVFADVLRRFLELAGHQVHQVMNITDVGHMTEDQLADGAGEDKMQLAMERMAASKKAGKVPQDAVKDPNDPYQIAEFFTGAFLEDARHLRLKVAEEYPGHMPRATEHIREMQALIRKLIDTGHAYVAEDGTVYYSVESFPKYGQLSGNTLEMLRGGAGGRVQTAHQAGKRHPADFLLWKPDPSHIMKWDSPWGVGYPGWHIECSAMAMSLLGREEIDIHTGGEDNILPHHECEIAQSCGATGKDRFARFWMHARFLLVEGEKMSKSKGNFYTVRDVLEGKVTGRRVDPAVLRWELLRTHYRSNANFTAKGLEDSAGAVRKLRAFAAKAKQAAGGARFSGRAGESVEADRSHPTVKAFAEALADDLNVSGAIGTVFKWMSEDAEQANPAEALAVLSAVNSVLDVLPGPSPFQRAGTSDEAAEAITPDLSPDEDIQAKCRQIDEARAAKDYATADHLREELVEAGYEVMTTKEGTTVREKLA